MTDLDNIRHFCETRDNTANHILNDILIPYVAERENYLRKLKKMLAPYRHVTKEMPEDWEDMIMTQFVTHRTFRENGLIHRYINHSEIKLLEDKKQQTLREMKEQPWFFRFSYITDNPATSFYRMYDIFRDEEFLLYSHGIREVLEKEDHIQLFFNLYSYNGMCWRSFGPVSYFQSFNRDDILFYATEIDDREPHLIAENINEIIETNPIPFMMLYSGARYPATYHGDMRLARHYSEYELPVETEQLRDQCDIATVEDVSKITLPDWEAFPHFAKAYYDHLDEVLYIEAMTLPGFATMADLFHDYGYPTAPIPELRVNMGMLTTASHILKREIQFGPWEHLFSTEEDETGGGQKGVPEEINAFLEELMPLLNSGEEPDIDALAARYGIDPENAREVVHDLLQKMGRG